MSQWFLSYRVLLFLFHFCVFLLQLSELVWKLAEGISLQSASKRLPSFGPSSNGNKSNAINTRICPNWNLTGTIYHWSVILRSFSVVSNSAKRDANGFFKLLLLSSHLLISGHPVRKSKFGACAVTGYCSFKCSGCYSNLSCTALPRLLASLNAQFHCNPPRNPDLTFTKQINASVL